MKYDKLKGNGEFEMLEGSKYFKLEEQLSSMLSYIRIRTLIFTDGFIHFGKNKVIELPTTSINVSEKINDWINILNTVELKKVRVDAANYVIRLILFETGLTNSINIVQKDIDISYKTLDDRKVLEEIKQTLELIDENKKYDFSNQLLNLGSDTYSYVEPRDGVYKLVKTK